MMKTPSAATISNAGRRAPTPDVSMLSLSSLRAALDASSATIHSLYVFAEESQTQVCAADGSITRGAAAFARIEGAVQVARRDGDRVDRAEHRDHVQVVKIGRASCRERV